jgi:hypothetical protein
MLLVVLVLAAFGGPGRLRLNNGSRMLNASGGEEPAAIAWIGASIGRYQSPDISGSHVVN